MEGRLLSIQQAFDYAPTPRQGYAKDKTATNRSRHGQIDIFSEEKVLGHPDFIDMAVRQEGNRISLVDLFHTCWEEKQ